jgi:hypothetical protein
MIENTGATIDHFIEEWTRQIAVYAERYKDNMTSRNIMDVRYVGADVGIDVVTKYDKTGPGAQILAKGAVPKSMSVSGSDTKHEIYQIGVGFNISQKDLALDPERHARTIDVALREIHRLEDDILLNGVTNIGLTGLITAAQANSNGKIVNAGAGGADTNNKGQWSGEADTDIYDDLLTADGKLDEEFDMAYLVGTKADLRYLWRLDAERNPYRTLSAPLFGKSESATDWMWKTAHLTAGKVYAIAKDFMGGELVVSENPSIVSLYNGGMGPGRNYYFEVSEWVVPEFHNNDAYVEIDIT